MKCQEIWIHGAGRYGRRALATLRQNYPSAEITIVDASPDVSSKIGLDASAVVCQDSATYLFDNLKEGRRPDWIIPMVPIHLAFEWIRLKLSSSYDVRIMAVPEKVIASLPNPMKGADGQVYISNANFHCPPNCPEPDELCTYTGKPRPRVLHEFLAKIQYAGFYSIVVQSRQILPGIGGYRPKDLFQALETITSKKGLFLLSTACRCHGVMHAFEVKDL